MSLFNKKPNVNNELLEFSLREWIAIHFFARTMAIADGRLDINEFEFISNEFSRFNLTKEECDFVLENTDNIEISEATLQIMTMNDSKKRYVCAFLGTLMAIDGDIDDKEFELWQKISLTCTLPAMTIKDAIEYMDLE